MKEGDLIIIHNDEVPFISADDFVRITRLNFSSFHCPCCGKLSCRDTHRSHRLKWWPANMDMVSAVVEVNGEKGVTILCRECQQYVTSYVGGHWGLITDSQSCH